MKFIYLCIMFALVPFLVSCGQDEFNSDNSIPIVPTVEGNLKDAPFDFGMAVNINTLKTNATYRQTIIDNTTRVTGENAMKMNTISLGQGRYDFSDGDYLVDFAQQNGLKVHGHTLLWYKHTPDWLKNYQGDSAAFVGIMKQYIYDVVGHYKGKVASWDVINEVINDKGEVYTTDGTKENIWMKKIGINYIALAFQFAHEADPDALLFYNEYGHEYSAQRRMGVNNLVKDLKAKGVPIDGVGLQMHTNTLRATSDIRNAIVMIAASTKVKVHVSELDVSVNSDSKIKDSDVTDSLKTVVFNNQQIWYREVSKAMNDLPVDQRYGITFWGVCDTNTSVATKPDWPLVFDANYQRKPAYQGLLQGFKVKY